MVLKNIPLSFVLILLFGLPGWDRIAGYFYPDSTIAGFSHTHLSGTGAGDLYDVSFMPVTLPYREAPQPLGIYSSFSHDDESVSAGYYQVFCLYTAMIDFPTFYEQSVSGEKQKVKEWQSEKIREIEKHKN